MDGWMFGNYNGWMWQESSLFPLFYLSLFVFCTVLNSLRELSPQVFILPCKSAEIPAAFLGMLRIYSLHGGHLKLLGIRQ
jgi:hypothetical protein